MALRGRLAILTIVISITMTAGMLAHTVGIAPSGIACLRTIEIASLTSTGSPFDGGTRLSWNVNKSCPDVEVTFAGTAATSGSVVVTEMNMSSEHHLVASVAERDETKTRILASRVAFSAAVIEYQRTPAGLTAQSGPTRNRSVEALATRVFGAMSEPAKRTLLGKKIEIHVIPPGVGLKDVPPWRESVTPSQHTGCSPVVHQDRVAVPVFTTEGTEPTGDPLAHGLVRQLACMMLGLSSSHFVSAVQATWALRGTQADYLGDDAVTKSDLITYWSEGVSALFGQSPRHDLTGEYSRDWLEKNDLPLLSHLLVLFQYA